MGLGYRRPEATASSDIPQGLGTPVALKAPRISIDGPTASGKTTLALSLAAILHVPIYDTGLTYRALALGMTEGRDQSDLLTELGKSIEHLPRTGGEWDPVLIDGVNRSQELFAPNLDSTIAVLAKDPRIRDSINTYHRSVLNDLLGVVAVGRDVAVNALERADCHIFLYASVTERQRRRTLQFESGGHGSAYVADTSDQDVATRRFVHSQAKGIVLDTEAMTESEVLRQILADLASLDIREQE